MEAEEAVKAAFIPGKKAKHKPPKKGKYNVQEDRFQQKTKKVPAEKAEPKKYPKKRNTRGKTAGVPQVDDSQMIANLILAKEVIQEVQNSS